MVTIENISRHSMDCILVLSANGRLMTAISARNRGKTRGKTRGKITGKQQGASKLGETEIMRCCSHPADNLHPKYDPKYVTNDSKLLASFLIRPSLSTITRHCRRTPGGKMDKQMIG